MAKRLILLTAGFVAVAMAPAAAQKPDDQIAAQSVALQRQGETALASGNFVAANDALETALAVDPRNRAVFVDLARVATRQKLFGKAIRFTGKALALEPNDRDALAVQGVAMVEAGATARAQQNLARLQAICAKAGCPQQAELGAAIAHGPTVVASKPAATQKN
ncbi:MAG: tetratricopeptide repeat protein [Sphingomicrobium sp.]|nr:tetratricopeptide repeat protein [Sphingomonadales bacterium]